MTTDKLNQIINDIADLQSYVVNGDTKALPAYVQLRMIADAAADALDAIKANAINERLKYGSEQVKINGYIVEINKQRKMYNYKEDATWNQFNKQLKDHESLMAMAAEGVPLANTATGEMITPAKVSFTAEGIKLTYKGE